MFLSYLMVQVSDGMELMVISILGPILQNAWGTTPVENALISTVSISEKITSKCARA